MVFFYGIGRLPLPRVLLFRKSSQKLCCIFPPDLQARVNVNPKTAYRYHLPRHYKKNKKNGGLHTNTPRSRYGGRISANYGRRDGNGRN